jgi:S-adenosylmethionine:tRNA ribosyltransferase-isomerase
VRLDAFQYELPAELIAQRPAERREHARLMLLPPSGAPPEDRSVGDLAELVPPGALVVVNDTRVIPARLLGRKRDSGGAVEIFLVRHIGVREGLSVWEALGRSSKPLREGAEIAIARRDGAGDGLFVRLLRRDPEGSLEVGLTPPEGATVDEALRTCGHVPLPPYIRRDDDASDADRYQTVYARNDGAVAAPTAGLHLTREGLERLRARGCEVAEVTLHVGLGTFQPVHAEDLSDHPMHAERYVVPAATASAVAMARARGAPVVAIGTTTVRALESAADPSAPGLALASEGDTRLLIQPGYSWRVVDGLLTNFHLPRSTLLALVCAFGGLERVLDAYRTAVARRYRFYSYGDAMLLWRGSGFRPRSGGAGDVPS